MDGWGMIPGVGVGVTDSISRQPVDCRACMSYPVSTSGQVPYKAKHTNRPMSHFHHSYILITIAAGVDR